MRLEGTDYAALAHAVEEAVRGLWRAARGSAVRRSVYPNNWVKRLIAADYAGSELADRRTPRAAAAEQYNVEFAERSA